MAALGFTLVLLVPVIEKSHVIGQEAARGRFETAKRLINMEVTRFDELAEAQLKNLPYPEIETRRAENAKAREAKIAELKKSYRLDDRERESIEAAPSSTVLKLALILKWLGQVALILGLLVMAVQNEGMRQKVLLIVLLVVLFSALSGVHLNFSAIGQLGPAAPETVAVP